MLINIVEYFFVFGCVIQNTKKKWNNIEWALSIERHCVPEVFDGKLIFLSLCILLLVYLFHIFSIWRLGVRFNSVVTVNCLFVATHTVSYTSVRGHYLYQWICISIYANGYTRVFTISFRNDDIIIIHESLCHVNSRIRVTTFSWTHQNAASKWQFSQIHSSKNVVENKCSSIALNWVQVAFTSG